MKKLALLLAALSVASVSYAKEVMPEAAPVVEEAVVEEVVEVKAAPVLRVTSVGQTFIVENTSGNENIGEAVHLENKVGLALGDNWTFDLMARKTWKASTDDVNVYDEYDNVVGTWDGVKSNGHRIELGATRHFENFAVGMKWRGESELDRLYLPFSYNFGLVSGWFEPAYTFYDKGDDSFYLKAEPVQLNYGPVTLAYYFEGEKFTGDEVKGEERADHNYMHQVRLRGTLYSNEVFSVGAEYRYQFAHEEVDKDGFGAEDKLENNRHIAILSGAYNVTENLTVDAYYEYDFNKYEYTDYEGKKESVDDDYYGEFGIGWTYKF